MVGDANLDAREIDARLLPVLEGICDPEIPVLNIVEMGIVRAAQVVDGEAVVRITPTYSGCPAMVAIQQEIVARLSAAGFQTRVDTVFEEAWTTAWLSTESREKLREYGIAPPTESSASPAAAVACPQCHSPETELKSYFGSTACKAMYVCRACAEPFEAFKCI